ncbi:MAG: hypothetical protein JNK46_10385 [Methylobacteriaceae bacterium]|nr:hypothetical protein [Methylobacteriaceae bacterium]
MDAAQKAAGADTTARLFHQHLIWPLQVMGGGDDEFGSARHWRHLADDPQSRWKEIDDEFTDDPRDFAERHYREFVAFLPHVQRFLYGERAMRGSAGYGESPVRVFRRMDVRKARCWFAGEAAPVDLEIVHCDLYFFFDVDVVILALEVRAQNLPLARCQEIMHRFGRAYPGGWTESGVGANCLARVAWLDGAGAELAQSDYDDRQKFVTSVCRHQAAAIAAHWEFLLQPMILNQSETKGALRYRQLEHYRMPLMAYLALDAPQALTRADLIRLTFAGPPGESAPLATPFLADFEQKHCYDRFWEPGRANWTNTRILCCGHSVVTIGEAGQPLYTDAERGFLSQFRHQLFYLALIAHFHRAAMLMLSDRLVTAMSRLDIRDQATVRRFRREVRLNHEVFLRFTHRYYFSEVSDQALSRDFFRMMNTHLGTARLYAELREEIHDMSHYLETDMLRRQAVTILRLTVVTLFSLIGNVTTGFLGMNLFSHAEMSGLERAGIFALVFIPAASLTMYAVLKSQRLSLFLDAVADERVGWPGKADALIDVWRRKPRGGG